MQHIHTNLETLACTTSRNECIVSPVVIVHTMEDNSNSHQSAPLMCTKKDDGDNLQMEMESIKPEKSENQLKKPVTSIHHPMEVETESPICPGKSQDKPMKLDVSYHEGSDDDKPVKHESFQVGESETDQSLKQKPVSPVEIEHSVDAQPIKLELSYSKLYSPTASATRLWFKPEPLSSEEAGSSDKNLSGSYTLYPSGSCDFDHQSIKPEPKYFQSTGDSDGEAEVQSSVVQAEQPNKKPLLFGNFDNLPMKSEVKSLQYMEDTDNGRARYSTMQNDFQGALLQSTTYVF